MKLCILLSFQLRYEVLRKLNCFLCLMLSMSRCLLELLLHLFQYSIFYHFRRIVNQYLHLCLLELWNELCILQMDLHIDFQVLEFLLMCIHIHQHLHMFLQNSSFHTYLLFLWLHHFLKCFQHLEFLMFQSFQRFAHQ